MSIRKDVHISKTATLHVCNWKLIKLMGIAVQTILQPFYLKLQCYNDLNNKFFANYFSSAVQSRTGGVLGAVPSAAA